jgi:curved DNA-binding protein
LENGPFVDYYEFLMISPQADRAMVEWAVRLMLARYGKKNDQQADEQKYNLVKDAYRTLADPKRRAAYDKERLGRTEGVSASGPMQGAAALPARVEGEPLDPELIRVELTANVNDVRLQKRIRQGIMSALYDVMITRPRNPELGRAEIARAVGVSIDEMEFAIWYCREQGLLRTTAQGLYALSTKGVDWVENGGVAHLSDKPGSQTVAGEPVGRVGQVAAGPRRVV